MVLRPAPERPMVFALALGDRRIVDAGEATAHQAVLVELPVLVTVGTEPLSGGVMRLVGEAHGDAVVAKRPQLLDQTVVELTAPLASQEGHDRLAADKELGAISPVAVGYIGERYP